jgi:hypothetical protein
MRFKTFGGVRRMVRKGKPAVPPTFDLLWDRQGGVGDPTDLKRLGDALNAWGLDAARKAYALAVVRGLLDGATEGLLTLVDRSEGPGERERLVIQADTRGSCGYVYLGAWLTEERDYANECAHEGQVADTRPE